MMRTVFLYLSGAGWARKLVTSIGVARRATRRFVAGETLLEAITVAETLNDKGIMVSLDQLGENVFNKADSKRATGEYIGLLEAIDEHNLDANISVKLTQLGLDISEDLVIENMRDILDKANEIGTTVNIDMEASEYVDATLRIFRQLNDIYDNVGTVIQAYLYRSESDMHQLGAEGAMVRLCKGAYKEPPDVAFPEKDDVDANFIKLMELYLSEKYREAGAYLKVATHDPQLIDETERFVREYNVPLSDFEFQMLYGIRSATQEDLVARGYKMRVYVPYGTEWYPYFMRRLAERPANVWFILRSLFAR
jgi:proline dehydrogenase